jgi:hypothetical protein
MARRDQVLSFHQVGEHRYELSGLRTGSVRDQILRAHLLVERLLADSDTSSDPLLIVGGGAAGVSAALTARRLRRDATLLELNDSPFQTQRGVTTRWLDPTEYDWPHAHWTAGHMGWKHSTFHLPFGRNWADQLADQWQFLWDSVVGSTSIIGPAGFGVITEYMGVNVNLATFSFTARSNGVFVTPLNAQFCAVISCVGFSGERTEVTSTSSSGKALVGPEFWSPDSLALPHLGLAWPDPYRRFRVLVSGGGDGAQQDYLRVLAGGFGRELFDRMGLGSLGLNFTNILLAEDAGRRAHAWSRPGSEPTEAYEEWHSAYELLADDVLAAWHADQAAMSRANGCLARANEFEVTWLFRETVPGYSYGLNRLLAILVSRLYSRMRGVSAPALLPSGCAPTTNEAYLPGFELSHVTPVDPRHRCGSTCYGVAHEVFITRAHGAGGTGPIHSLGAYDVLIVRHGQKQNTLFGAPPVSEQLVPYDLPK